MDIINANIKKFTVVASAALGSLGTASAVISLDFTDFAVAGGSTTTFSSAGDEWISQNVIIGTPTTQADAIFTIFSTDDGTGSPIPTNQVFFADEAARGNNARVRVGGSQATAIADAYVFITISFVEAGTNTPYNWGASDELITQFSDLDSDFSQDRTDFAGAANGSFTSQATSDIITPGSSSLVFDTSSIIGYEIARLGTPWGPQGNIVATDASSQSPVTAAFTRDAVSSFSIVVGQLSNGDTGNRHIDIDMTPDFTIVPEPSAFGMLIGLAAITFVGLRRRSR